MAIVTLLTILVYGVFVGIVFSAIGAAGGILTSFGLITLFGVLEPNAVKPMTQIVVLATALIFVPGYLRRASAVVPLGLLLGGGGLIGAYAGSTLSSLYLSDMADFRPLFGFLTLAVAAQIFWKLLGPEPVELETLEAWLSYIMERESTVSAMIGNMKINHMEAKSIVFKVEHLFTRLNEGTFKDYPKNFELESEKYGRIVRSFENYIVRSEALKSRLETAMGEVRTYLSLQQQKLAMEEQKSSKEQLVRLVNLQEIFHKVEIFIVAVYITEMAHIVFEVITHEKANLLTAFFIPIALVLAIGISRILHKE